MVVTYVMVVVCVVGVIGAVASALGYDQAYGEISGPMRIPKQSRRSAQGSRPSRQLKALEAALAEDAPLDQPPPPAATDGGADRRHAQRPLGAPPRVRPDALQSRRFRNPR
jgi:hypothetical protein